MTPPLMHVETWLGLARDPRLGGWLQVGGLLGARLLPLVMMSPVFGGRNLPVRARLALCLMLVGVYWPAIAGSCGQGWAAGPFGLLMLKETAIGLTAALMVVGWFEAAAAAGGLVDMARGGAMASLLDPQSHQPHSPMGLFHHQLAVALFVALGGHRALIESLGWSFAALPVDAAAPPHLVGTGAIGGCIALASDLLTLGMRLAAPALLAALIGDVCLGVVNRMAPRIEAYFLGLPLKALIGLACTAAALGITMEVTVEALRDGLGALADRLGAR